MTVLEVLHCVESEYILFVDHSKPLGKQIGKKRKKKNLTWKEINRYGFKECSYSTVAKNTPGLLIIHFGDY